MGLWGTATLGDGFGASMAASGFEVLTPLGSWLGDFASVSGGARRGAHAATAEAKATTKVTTTVISAKTAKAPPKATITTKVKPAKPALPTEMPKEAPAKPATTKVTTKEMPAKPATTKTSASSSPEAPRLKKDGTPAAKTGPKTDDTSPHNARIKKEVEKLEAEGNKIVKGGRVPGSTEEVVDTKGGYKDKRRPDITYLTPEGELRGRNVGKTKADGTPVKREQQALDDLNNHSDRKTDFVPYDR